MPFLPGQIAMILIQGLGIEPLALAVCLGFVAVFAAVIAGVVRLERKRKERKTAQAARLGFQPMPKPNPAQVEQILEVFRRQPKQILVLRNVYYQRSLEGDLYLVDVWDPSGEGGTQLAGDAVVFIAPGAGLPFFSIFPILEGSGWVSSVVNRMLKWAMSYRQVVPFEGVPEFDSRFIVLVSKAQEDIALRGLLTPNVRHRLGDLHMLAVHAGGDVLAISSAMIDSAHETEKQELINRLISEVITLSHDLWSERERTSSY